MPVVHSFGKFAEDPGVHVVGIDNKACGRMAAETLLARGYKRLAFLGGPAQATSTVDRRAGFVDAVRAHRDASVTESYAAAYSFDAGRAAMLELLRGTPAEAYFCGDDVIAVGALSALHDRGFRVPQEVGVIGLNDMEMSRWQNINLTTIRQPIRQIISTSIERVVSLIDAPQTAPLAQLFDCEIVERGTLRPLS